MICTPPIPIVGSVFVSSTVPALNTNPSYGDVEVLWVSGTTYAIGDKCAYAGRKYQRLIAGAGTTVPSSDTTNWLDIGPTNQMAMFDLYRNSQTVYSSPITVVLQPGKRINSFAIGGLEATSVELTMTVGATTVYNKTYMLNNRKTTSWYEYYFGGFSTKPSTIDFELPPYSGAQITVTITNTGGNVKCGALVIGTSVYLGDAESASGSSLNFSVISRDAFGNATLVPRRSVPKTVQTLMADRKLTDSIKKLKQDTDAVPAVWCGVSNPDNGVFELLLIFGIWKNFDIDGTSHIKTRINLEVEEI